MRPPEEFVKVVDGKRFSVATATLIAGDDHWDGHNFERSGRNTFLYRTPRNSYFEVTLSQWQGERDSLSPLSTDEAAGLFERMSEPRMSFEEAFPGVKVVDA